MGDWVEQEGKEHRYRCGLTVFGEESFISPIKPRTESPLDYSKVLGHIRRMEATVRRLSHGPEGLGHASFIKELNDNLIELEDEVNSSAIYSELRSPERLEETLVHELMTKESSTDSCTDASSHTTSQSQSPYRTIHHLELQLHRIRMDNVHLCSTLVPRE